MAWFCCSWCLVFSASLISGEKSSGLIPWLYQQVLDSGACSVWFWSGWFCCRGTADAAAAAEFPGKPRKWILYLSMLLGALFAMVWGHGNWSVFLIFLNKVPTEVTESPVFTFHRILFFWTAFLQYRLNDAHFPDGNRPDCLINGGIYRTRPVEAV